MPKKTAVKQKAVGPIELPENITREMAKEQLASIKKANFEYQKPRHPQWDENYMLYRDKVQTNRLTQRQAVNIPLMKETIRTVLSKIDERPDIAFIDKAGDLEREIALNAKWDDDCDKNDIELVDIVDKKQVLLFGRSTKKINFIKGKISFELKDVFDVLPDRSVNPLNIKTARSIVEPHILRPVQEIMKNDRYDKVGREELKKIIDEQGTQGKQARSALYQEMARARRNRMVAVGAKPEEDDYNKYRQVEELVQTYCYFWDEKLGEYVPYVCITALNDTLLRAKPIKKELGVEFWPFESWADDVENNDFYTDSLADVIRVPNQIMNIWMSQFLENRTLRNFGMNYYNSTIKGFKPSTFRPGPGAWFPLPGKPADVYQHVDIPDISSTMNEIQFVIGLAEKASATGAIEKGVVEQAKRTLGEIEIAVGKAEQRTTSLSKFYRLSWKRYAENYYQLLDANMRKESVKLYKRAPNGKMVARELKREDLISPDGVRVIATSANEQATDRVDKLQRLQAVKQEFPDNVPLQKAVQKRMLALADLTAEEVQEIEQFEANKQSAAGSPMASANPPGMDRITQAVAGAGLPTEQPEPVPEMA